MYRKLTSVALFTLQMVIRFLMAWNRLETLILLRNTRHSLCPVWLMKKKKYFNPFFLYSLYFHIHILHLQYLFTPTLFSAMFSHP